MLLRRRQRMADLKKAAQAKRFGSVVDIGGADFVREVTHAGPEVWVVLHLYKDGCAVPWLKLNKPWVTLHRQY